MTGIKEDELYDHLMNNHEIEFTYSNSTFIIQPEARESGNYLTIWSLGETSDLVCEVIINGNTPSSDELSDLFQKKCFKNLSFNEVKNDIRITNIF